MADTVQQVKDRLSIVDVVSQYVKLERRGGSLRARCPFHAEKTPSFFVSPERGTYHCFGCGVGGDIFSFVEAVEGLDFKGALKVLAEKAGVELVYERGGKEQKDERDRLLELMEAATIFYVSRSDDAAKKYLKERGLSEQTVKAFRLGLAGDEWSALSDFLKTKKFSDKEILDAGVAKKNERGSLTDKFRNRIMFPIADSAGRIVGFSGRIFGEKASPEAPKYLNSPETPLFHKSRILYGFDRAKQSIRKVNCAVLVEGQVDLLASHQAGWGNTVAVSGTAFTTEHAALIRRMTDNLVIALDADEAGIKAASRAAREALRGSLNVKVARLPDGLDPADLILKEGAEAWKKAIRDSKDIITFLLDVLEEHSKGADRFRRAVETVVLPFLSDVASPIAREQYLREIAKRLDVSESAVQEALGKVPTAPAASDVEQTPTQAPADLTRVKQAYAILLWQRSLPKAHLDLKEFERELEEAMGAEALARLKKSSDAEAEALRFSAERLYGESRALSREAKTLLHIILKERLARELSEAAAALKKAEKAGDEEQVKELLTVNNVLTTRIAKLHENV
jgi:DNA primase